MASLDEVRVSAYRVGTSAKELKSRSMRSAEAMARHVSQLAPLVHGSRSGDAAVQQIREADRATRECAAAMLQLEHAVTTFINATRNI